MGGDGDSKEHGQGRARAEIVSVEQFRGTLVGDGEIRDAACESGPLTGMP
jgi:hypothetical protein